MIYILVAKLKIFGWSPSCGSNIFIMTTPTHIYKFIHTFLFDKLYIYTHPSKKIKIKKILVFSIKIMFVGNLS